MEILITYGHREEDLASLPIRDLALFVLEREGKPINTEVSISFVDDTAMAELNERFRGSQEAASPAASKGKSRFCPYCGTAVTGEFRFCSQCGKELP